MSARKNTASDNKVQFHVAKDDRFVDLNLYQFGREHCEPLHSYGPATRNHYLIHLVISGRGTLRVVDTLYEIGPGQGFLICPGQITTYYADENDPWDYAWLEFDGLVAHESVTLAGLKESAPVYTPVTAAAGRDTLDELLYIVDHPADRTIRLVGHAMIFLDKFIQSSVDRVDAGRQRLRDFYLKEAITFVDANYARSTLSVEEISDACGLNRSYFGRVFKTAMGESPQQFLMHYRMAKAAQLLKTTRIPIKDISAAVGYPNQLHFSRAFKSLYGISPRAWRDENLML